MKAKWLLGEDWPSLIDIKWKGSSRFKFYMEFDVIPMYLKDPDMLIKMSNRLNIQVKDKVVMENFRSQLKNARANGLRRLDLA